MSIFCKYLNIKDSEVTIMNLDGISTNKLKKERKNESKHFFFFGTKTKQ